MQVTLYEFVKRENSTKRPTDSTPSEITGCVLKDATSIIRPTLVFTGLGNPTRFNYLYIEELGGRYYFIEDWVSVRNRWECTCTVDVLASFKPEIGDSTEYILRSSAEKDTYVVDTTYPTKADVETMTYYLNHDLNPGPDGLNGGTYVIGCIDHDPDAYGAVCYYLFTASDFRTLVSHLFDGSLIDGQSTDLDLIKANLNPIQYIVSVKWFPPGVYFARIEENKKESISLGWYTVLCNCYKLTYTTTFVSQIVELPKHPQAETVGKYLNGSPFTRYSIVYMPFGEVVVDPAAFVTDEKLRLYIRIDAITGVGTLSLNTGETALAGFSPVKADVGVDIKLAQVASDFVGTATSAIGGIASAISSFVTGNIAGGIAGASNAVGNFVDNMLPQMSSVGGVGGVTDLATSPIIKAQFIKIVQTDNTRLGSPLCKIRKISAIPGYIQVNDADFRASCTAQENVMIKDYMEGGFFYE